MASQPRLKMNARLSLLLAGLLVALLLAAGGAPAHAAGSSVVAWGLNDYGQTTVPADLSGVTAVAASWGHSLALKGDGTVVAWGRNNYGQTTVPDGLTGVTAVAAGEYHSLALKGDGTVVAWGLSSATTVPGNLSGVTAIAAGAVHSLALKNDGTVVAWGNNDYGQSAVPANLTGVTAIAAGGFHSLALMDDGTVVGWGSNSDGQSTVPANLTGVTAIAAGRIHSLALQGDGTVVGWGSNNVGQSTAPDGLSDVIAIAAGTYHNLALKSDGTVVAWEYNIYDATTVPAGLSGVSAIAAGHFHSVVLGELSSAPSVSAGDDVSGAEGSPIALAGSATGPDNDPLTYAWTYSIDTADAGTTCAFGDASAAATTITCTDDGTFTATLTVDDGVNPPVSDSATVTVANADPTIDSLTPSTTDQVPLGTIVSLTVAFSDAGSNDTHTTTFNWGDGTLPTTDSSHTYAAGGVYTVVVTVTDDDGGGDTESYASFIVNAPPTVNAGGAVSGAEGSPIALAGSATDPDNDPLTYTWTYSTITADSGTTCTFGNAAAAATTITCTDDGTFTAKLTVADGVNPPVSDSATVTVKNVAPTITALVPSADVVPVGSKVGFTVSYSDPGANDAISIEWSNNASTATSATYSYNAAGLYTVTVTVSDDDGGADTESYRYVVVYDPARTIKGDGATLSPAGAYVSSPSLQGKAIFTFSVQYKKGATVPSGSLSYQVGRGFRFASTSSDWLVALGPDAKYQGSGTVNGSGDYAFMLTVHDGQATGGGGTDQFRLKVWDKATGEVVYDNQAGVADDAWGGPPISSGDIATTTSPVKKK